MIECLHDHNEVLLAEQHIQAKRAGTMDLEKRYLERNPGPWFKIDEEQTRKQLQRCFIDPEPLIEELRAGNTVRTAFAEYRLDQD